MADTYTVVTQYPQPIYLGGTQTQPATAVGIVTKPHGVYLEFQIPQTEYSAQQVSDYSTGYAGTVESLFGITGVTGLEWQQQPTPAGELTSVMVVYFTTPSGNSAGSLTVPFSELAPELIAPMVAAAITELVNAEGL